RGPQGTLFGRNATGGAIRYLVTTPTNKAEGYVEGSLGAWDERNVRAAYGGPITDTLSFRGSFVYEDFGGEVKDPVLNRRVGEQKYIGVRGVAVWKPTADITATLRAQYFKGDQFPILWKSTPGIS